MLAKAVLGNDENTKLSDVKLTTISKIPSQSEALVAWFGCASYFVFCRVTISYLFVTLIWQYLKMCHLAYNFS
ncbi:hypothetical protein A9Q81_26765 [Gammaproteobacteria bacterium 42_54_T18]|nr:hypothetical protein A9Q81_26765 [Gammaproteobacteria bacterium 42_54_T18]